MQNLKRCLIGVGHPFRGDDGLGYHALERLKNQLPSDIDTYHDPGDMARLIDHFENYDEVYLIDAISTGQAPTGTYYCIDLNCASIVKESMNSSTHILNLSQTIELAKALGVFPKICLCFGLEAEQFTPSQQLSSPVMDNLPILCDKIIQALTKD